MSGLINKVKDALHKDKNDDSRSDNYGPHSSNTANYADPRVDSDLSGGRQGTAYGGAAGTTDTYGSTGAGYGSSTTAGPHSSSLANKADPRVDSNLDGSRTVGGSGYGSTGTGYGANTTSGPHDSNFANRADPRVDSDLDGSRTVGGSGAGYSSNTAGGYGSNTTSGYGSNTTAGPHASNLANRADPRIDSDLDGSRTVSGSGAGYGSTGTGSYGSAPVHDATTTSSYGNTGSSNVGPHNSNLANKLDPRVDSDLDNRNNPTSRVGGYGGQDNYGVSGSNPTPSSGYGNTGYAGTQSGAGVGQGYGGQSGTTGYGDSGYGASGDRYDSSATPGTGNAPSTAGPHNSNLLNKLDPRVDSDMDGSKTYGGDATRR